MKKKDFQKLIEDHIDKFICLSLEDVTTRYGFYHTAIMAFWNNGIGSKTTIKVMRGKKSDLRIIEEFNKYKSWL